MGAEQFRVGSAILERWQDAVEQCAEQIGGQRCS